LSSDDEGTSPSPTSASRLALSTSQPPPRVTSLPFHDGALAVDRRIGRCPRLCGHVSRLVTRAQWALCYSPLCMSRILPQTRIRRSRTIAYALHWPKLHSSVTFASLVLLQWLEARFPTAQGSSAHPRLFISDFVIASKVVYGDAYSNKSWSIVGQGMFQLREINQMEREMCQYRLSQLYCGMRGMCMSAKINKPDTD
jgi:hypothetical protein